MHRLVAKNIGKRFGPRVLFRRLSFEAAPGRTLAITGSNGSGKSTLVRILVGVLAPSRGSVELTVDSTLVPDERRPLNIGLVAPYLNVYEGFTPAENLRFIARARGMKKYRDRIDEVLELVSLIDRADDPVSTFSSGMRQRVRFATAIFTDPAMLVLDEPSANLDESGIIMVRTLIQSALERGCLVLVATNDRSEAEACDETLCVEDFE
jgi:heme exporter protein A